MPFQPTDLPGIALWLDGTDDASVTTSGVDVVRWADKSGHGNHADAEAIGFPSFAMGDGGVTFNAGVGDRLRLENLSTGPAALIAAVVFNGPQTTGGSLLRPIIASIDDPYANAAPFPARWSLDLLREGDNGYGSNFPHNSTLSRNVRRTAAATNALELIATTSTGSVGRLLLNGAELNRVTHTPTSTPEVGYRLGHQGDFTGRSFNGLIGSVIIVDGDVSNEDREKVEGFLAWTHGIASKLRSDHPYLTIDPRSATRRRRDTLGVPTTRRKQPMHFPTNASDVRLLLHVEDADGLPVIGLTHDAAGLTVETMAAGASSWSLITLVAGSAGGWTSGAWRELGGGAYEFGLPASAVVAGQHADVRVTSDGHVTPPARVYFDAAAAGVVVDDVAQRLADDHGSGSWLTGSGGGGAGALPSHFKPGVLTRAGQQAARSA